MKPAHPALVSRLLREAGLPRGGRYTAWGYKAPDGSAQDGLKTVKDTKHHRGVGEVHESTWVYTTLHYGKGHEQIAEAKRVLEGHGFVVNYRGREPKSGDSRAATLDVWRSEAPRAGDRAQRRSQPIVGGPPSTLEGGET